MPITKSPRAKEMRTALEQAVSARLNAKLLRIQGTDAESTKKRHKLRDDLQLEQLLSGGAKCVSRIQLATHILKGIHPDLKVKEATNLIAWPSSLESGYWVGSHVLKDDLFPDTTGDGAYNTIIYELSRVLLLRIENTTFIALLQSGDTDAVAALAETQDEATARAEVLVTIDGSRCSPLASHTKAKQLYWLAGTDAHNEVAFHLLAPLYPTMLVHQVYLKLQDDRFSEEAKAARTARKEGSYHPRAVCEYRDLAIQQLGGTKPQNISQLNSERRGNNCLLASLPPMWQSAEVRPLLSVSSMFKVFGRLRDVQQQARALRHFLESKPLANMDTRRKVLDWVNGLIDEFLQFSAGLQMLVPGWSLSPDCYLSAAQRLWLDPDAAEQGQSDVIASAERASASDDTADQVAADFARWLNTQLRDPLPIGDPEFVYWRTLARDQIKQQEREVA